MIGERKIQKTNRRTMAIIRHMRRSAFSQAGRPDKGNCLESGEIRSNMLTRQTLWGIRPISDEWLNYICRFDVMEGKRVLCCLCDHGAF
jgi:hypothetical protein